MSKRRVVVTGLGCISPVGLNAQQSWQSLINGQSGVRSLDSDRLDLEKYPEFPVRIAGTVDGFDPETVVDKKTLKKMDRFIHLGMAAADEALKDSGMDIDALNSERIGCVIGSGVGGIPMIEDTKSVLENRGTRRISPFFVPAIIINMISGHVSMRYGLQGPTSSVVTACASGTHSIGEAARMIAYGDADAMLAGGAESCISELTLGGFAAAKALSMRNDSPESASRPFDAGRDGFVMGEGAGVLVLESYEHATARGARIYAELSGFGMSSDAYHMTMPSENGEGAARCMKTTLKDAQLNADAVGYINAHGTSTPAGDIAETQAIKTAFAGHANSLLVSSTKSMTGHLLGAAGGVEAVFSVQALIEQTVPPTINQDESDPACDLDVVPNEAREAKLQHVMSNSFGFGGTNASLIFSACR